MAQNIVYLGAPEKNVYSAVVQCRVLENVNYFKLVASVDQDFYILTDFFGVYIYLINY